MLLIRSLLFNLFLYTGIVFIFLIAIPTLLMPPKFTLFFGKFLGYYIVFVVRFFLSTKVEFKGIENIPKTENILWRQHTNQCLKLLHFKVCWTTQYLY